MDKLADIVCGDGSEGQTVLGVRIILCQYGTFLEPPARL
jgi:hypothetical protein